MTGRSQSVNESSGDGESGSGAAGSGAAGHTVQMGTTARVMYPSPAAYPDRRIARRARILVDDAVTVVGADGRVARRFPVGGPDGVAQVVHVSVPNEASNVFGRRGRPLLDDVAGTLDLVDGSGRVLMTVPLAAWLPGVGQQPAGTSARDLHDLAYRNARAVFRFGADRLPVRTVRQLDDPLFAGRERRAGAFRADLGTVRPEWLMVITWLLPLAAVAMLVIGTRVPALLLPAAAVGLWCPGALVAYQLWLWTRDRPSRVRSEATLRPSPGRASPGRSSPGRASSGGPSTRRFRRFASVRVVSREICFVDGYGAELWLPLGGAGVRSCVVLVDPGSGERAFVRWERGGGVAVATLPWSVWFGDGDEGFERLTGFAAAAGVTVAERAARDDVLAAAAGADRFRPQPWPRLAAGSAVTATPVTHGVVHVMCGAVAVVAGFSQTNGTTSLVAAVLGGLTVALATLPYLARRALRQLWWDRPSTAGSAR